MSPGIAPGLFFLCEDRHPHLGLEAVNL